jgi:predicted MFS family arabinose efflux permease
LCAAAAHVGRRRRKGNVRLRNYLKSLDPRLPRDVWVLQVGGLVNSFGNGLVLPFLIIYLHNVRDVPLGLAGLIAATNSAAALVTGFVAGSLSDRIGPRTVLMGALALMAFAISLFPLIRSAWHAFALSAALGAGSGAFWPSQSALVNGLTPQRRRHSAFAVQRVTMNLGVALGGVTGGVIASSSHPATFTVLFLLDAATFVGYVVVLAGLKSPELHPEREEGSYREVVRDRPFITYVSLNALFIAASMATFVELLPPFAKNDAGVSEFGVGVIWFVDALVVVLAQLPVAKLAEGRRRMHGLALMGLIWAAVMIGIDAGGYWLAGAAATAVFAALAFVFGIGECLHGTIHVPLAADLASPRLIGRYMAFSSQSWQVGWIIGPAAGGFILQHQPYALWPIAAAANLIGAAWALTLERRLPRDVVRTPADVLPHAEPTPL